jgi:GNAT superfamily N-acetyltransferase
MLTSFVGRATYDHEALGALSEADGRGVGIARYIRSTDDPLAADVAVTVTDDWQRRGLAIELLTRLTERAQLAGIRRYTVLIADGNVAVQGLLRSMGLDIQHAQPSLGTVTGQITLPSRFRRLAGEHAPLSLPTARPRCA